MKGSYVLLIELSDDQRIIVGKLGKLYFKKGFYLYVGSALNNLEKRIQRHLNAEKKCHWHIDYLLKKSKINRVYYKESNTKEECIIANYFFNEFEPILNFGCTDCRCKSHLFYGEKQRFMLLIDKLYMKDFSIL